MRKLKIQILWTLNYTTFINNNIGVGWSPPSAEVISPEPVSDLTTNNTKIRRIIDIYKQMDIYFI
jgi:hypothetical protein